MRISRIVALLAVLLILLGIGASSVHTQRAAKEAMAEGQAAQEVLVGGIQDAPGKENDLHVLDLARFAVDEHNKKANALLEFEKLVKVKEQVVAGTMYYFTIAAKDGGVTKLYEAKVWEKVWMNFKQLEEFKPAGDAASA